MLGAPTRPPAPTRPSATAGLFLQQSIGRPSHISVENKESLEEKIDATNSDTTLPENILGETGCPF